MLSQLVRLEIFKSMRTEVGMGKDINYTHILGLIVLAILVKIIVSVLTVYVFKSMIDTYDMKYYHDSVALLFQGKIPYVDFSYDYPLLSLIPMIIAYIPSMIFNNLEIYFFTFQSVMVICDIGITMCVYLIALKIWDNKKALYAAVLYLTSISVAYCTITKFDAFPTCLMMIGLTCLIYGKDILVKSTAYVAIIIGIFIKIFPGVAIPFMVMYNLKDRDFSGLKTVSEKLLVLKSEIFPILKYIIPMGVVLVVPFLFVGAKGLIFQPLRSESIDNANSFSYMVYSWVHEVCGIPVELITIQNVMMVIAIAGILVCLYYMYKSKGKDPILLLKLLACSFILIFIAVKVKGPQYVIWFTPMLCILAVDDLRKIILVYIMQIIMFIEFPLMMGILYITYTYKTPILSSEWYTALIFFTIEYMVIITCVGIILYTKPIMEKIEVVKEITRKKKKRKK